MGQQNGNTKGVMTQKRAVLYEAQQGCLKMEWGKIGGQTWAMQCLSWRLSSLISAFIVVCSETRRATLVGLLRSISWGLENSCGPLLGGAGVLLNCTEEQQVPFQCQQFHPSCLQFL
jgi:hypothetical protein